MTHLELRAIKDELGLTRPTIARAVNVQVRTVGRWISGQSRIPSRVVRLMRQAKQRGYWSEPKREDG